MKVKDYLEQVAALRRGVGYDAALRYHGFEDLTLSLGKQYTRVATPEEVRAKGLEMGALQQCFRNAWNGAVRNRGLTYVEGWAFKVIPIHHAWLVDRDGVVYDVTWDERVGGPGSDYFGVPMDTTWVTEHLSKTRVLGIFDASQVHGQSLLDGSGMIRTAGPAGNMVPMDRFPVLAPNGFGPKDVKVLRMAQQDIDRLHPGQRAKVMDALEGLRAGTVQIEPKERPPLVGTYTVRVTNSLRIGLYLTTDQPGGDPHADWVVYIVTNHDYGEAERRMQHNASSLTLEDYISVAEEAVERSHAAAGRRYPLPDKADYPKAYENPEYWLAMAPITDMVHDILDRGGSPRPHLRVTGDGWHVTQMGVQGATDGLNWIDLRSPASLLTILHECAHVIRGTGEGQGHDRGFVDILAGLLETHVSAAAADQFAHLVGFHDEMRS